MREGGSGPRPRELQGQELQGQEPLELTSKHDLWGACLRYCPGASWVRLWGLLHPPLWTWMRGAKCKAHAGQIPLTPTPSLAEEAQGAPVAETIWNASLGLRQAEICSLHQP